MVISDDALSVLTECSYAPPPLPDYTDDPFCRGGATFSLGQSVKK